MSVNKKYKDSLFRSIFNNEINLLELYNAIMGTNYKDWSIIEINTLTDVLFAAMKNDISFNVNKKMVILIEHQSTINENMPLRMLSYIADIYEKMTDERIYKNSLIKIPEPKFIVLYNGTSPFPKEKYLKLSDAFEKIDSNSSISLDLIARVININKEYNPELMRRSKTLDGYATFVAKVREYEKEYPFEEAVKLAVKYCMENGILVDYFKQNSTEVVNMFTEYNVDIAMKVAREEGIEKGQNHILELMAQGLSYEEIKKKIEETSK
ncbi:MAG: Rpn family recombination-promoting nuclease/putative transposase [Leptospirales bacterium]|nr:Rpn family recombination-promoting nuclease/putative transposase [Leptospirales bacterium]